MRRILLLCTTIGLTLSAVNFWSSTLYDVYDFDQPEIHLGNCDSGCLIYAATMGEMFEQYPNKMDPYASNILIRDNDIGSDIMSVAEVAARVDSSKAKLPLHFKGPANISVINTNPIDAEKFTVALYVANTTLGPYSVHWPHVVYDIADVAGSVLKMTTRNVTFISARPYRLEAERSDKPNNISVILAGYFDWETGDYCPVALETRNASWNLPFPGFVIQPNTPLVTVVMATSAELVMHPSYDYDESRQISDNGFITSPGWNGCTRPLDGGIQTFRSPFDKPSASVLLKSDNTHKVDLLVRPNLDTEHPLLVQVDGGLTQYPSAIINGSSPDISLSYSGLSGSQGFLATYYAYAVEEPKAWVASESYCNCDMTDGKPVNWKPSEINLDILIIIDTSASMAARLQEAKDMVTSFIRGMTTDPQAEFYTNIGVIAGSDKAEIIYNMNMSSADNLDSIKPNTVAAMDFNKTFPAAVRMLINAGPRTRRPIIYILTNSSPSQNVTGAEYFRINGFIIVNEFISAGASPRNTLKDLASANYYFTDLSNDFTSNWGVFCEASCYCNFKEWDTIHAFNDDTKSVRTHANRGCYHQFYLPYVSQQNAREICQAQGYKGAGALVSIHDQDKEFFVNSVETQYGPETKYWIGLQYNGTAWNWDDKSTSTFTDWDAGQPNTNGGKNRCAYAVQTTGFNVKWTAADCDADGILYVCETAPCSVGNKYC